jgi:sigma-B regulation protein RsbU (phosphoserine phosphatase)
METSILEEVRDQLREKRANLSAWLRTTPRPKRDAALGPASDRDVRAHLQTLDEAITKAETGTLGECVVCHMSIEPERLQMDYTACVCLDHFAPHEVRELERELELAQQVQRGLLPHDAPTVPGLEIAAFSRPAQFVSGDYFDFVAFEDGAQGFAIADVAGHGMSSSLHMASIQTLLRTLAPTHTSPAEVVQQIHKLYHRNVHFTSFVTLFVGALDVVTHRLTYANAGHNPPLVLRNAGTASGTATWLAPTGPAIGLVEEAEFGERAVELRAGDLLVLYTDGITEMLLPENVPLGQEGLSRLLASAAHQPAQDIVRAVRQQLDAYSAAKPLADDVTLVVGKVNTLGQAL